MSAKKPAPPAAWKNSFFWFAGVLFLLGCWGLIAGDNVIRDPGQIREGNLALYYFAGAIVMVVNGFLTHKLAVKAFQEEKDAEA